MNTIAETLAQIKAQLTGPGAPFELIDVDVDGRRLPAYRNARETIPDMINAARVHGDKTYIVYEGDTWSFNRLFAAADSLAWALREQFGVKPGDRVAIAMRNRPEWAVAFIASALAGAVPAPINSFGLQDELSTALADVQPKVLLADADRVKRIGTKLSELACVTILCDAEPAAGSALHSLSALLATRRDGPPPVQVGPNDPGLLLFTSGSTSRAKGVLSTQRAVCQALFNIEFIAALSAISSPGVVADLLKRGDAPTILTAVPLFHVSGLHAQLLSALINGRRLVFVHKWDPAQAIGLIRDQRVTAFQAAPSMIMQVLEHPLFDFDQMRKQLAAMGFGGSGLPQRLIDEVLQRFGPSMSGIGFGLTESNGVGSAISGDGFAHAPRSSGIVSPVMKVRIANAEGQALADGETGEIWLSGVTVMREYWNMPGPPPRRCRTAGFAPATSATSGRLPVRRRPSERRDQPRRREDRRRRDRVVPVATPGSGRAAVLGIPDAKTGEAVVAVVSAHEGRALEPEALRKFVAARLASYKVPTRIVVADKLPRNPTGKLLKTDIRKQWFPEA
jgi:long-chain acyl-CoA synthetase